jgi:hypothetical protein
MSRVMAKGIAADLPDAQRLLKSREGLRAVMGSLRTRKQREHRQRSRGLGDPWLLMVGSTDSAPGTTAMVPKGSGAVSVRLSHLSPAPILI